MLDIVRLQPGHLICGDLIFEALLKPYSFFKLNVNRFFQNNTFLILQN